MVVWIDIKSSADDLHDMAMTLRMIADKLDSGFISGYEPTFEIVGEEDEEPETLEVEDIEKYAGETIRVCGRNYTLRFEDTMSGKSAVWESERFGGGKRAYLIYATPNFELLPVPVDIRIGEFDENGLTNEFEIEYVNNGETYYGSEVSDEKVTSFDEYKNTVIMLASDIITEFEDAEDKKLV